MKSKIITYSNQIDDAQFLLGMQVLPDTAAKQYLKAVKLLEENNIQFEVLDDRIQITRQDFQVQPYSASDAKPLLKYFQLEVLDGYSEAIGIFPDAITIAIEERTNG